jgi:CheY-like chemotaxis protein
MLPPFLLLEDSYTDVQAMTTLFKRIGLVNPVRIIGTVADAQRLLADAAPARLPVIVFAGSPMRGVHGLDLIDWMRHQPDPLGRIAAIALLDRGDEVATARAAARGVAIVDKPVDMWALIGTIRALGLVEKSRIDQMTLTVQVELYSREAS